MAKYIAALCVGNKVVVGSNHGDAFSKLNHDEKAGNIESGFFDPLSGRFFTEEYDFYLKQIYVIRHGEAEGQHFNAPLTITGIKQCVACADFLVSQDVQDFEIYCSPYARCVQTAQIISEITTRPQQILDNLQKQQDEEPVENFLQRVDRSLAEIAPKAIIISHADFILQFVAEAVGPEFCTELENGIPNCFVMLIDARRLVRCVSVE